MDIYLDIDGVLLTKDGKMAQGLDEFLDFVVDNFDCYWLTTHCKANESRVAEHLKTKVSEKVLTLTERIKPTSWQDYKTDGINFEQDFLWLDDNLFIKEREALVKQNALSKHLLIDLKSNPNQLLDVLEMLKL